jgi:purine-binding chemotaxis protein CheW
VKPVPRSPQLVEEELRVLLERRTERLRSHPPRLDETAVLWAGEFPVGEERYALPLDVLRAAVPLRTVTPVPLSPPHVVGILRFRGQILTALSLSSLLGGRGWREDPAVLLVVDAGTRLVALDCEQVPKPIGLPATLVEEARARSHGLASIELLLPGPRQLNLLDLRYLLAAFDVGARHA